MNTYIQNPKKATQKRNKRWRLLHIMKITICDDSIKDLLKKDKLLSKYKILYPGRDFELEKFSDPSRLY